MPSVQVYDTGELKVLQPGFLPGKALAQVIDLCTVLLEDPVLDSSGDVLHLQYSVLWWSAQPSRELRQRSRNGSAYGEQEVGDGGWWGWHCPGALMGSVLLLEMDIQLLNRSHR